jgi:protein-disulfide isomerase
MTHRHARRSGLTAPLLAGMMALLSAASACAAQGGGAAAGHALPTQDSILARASRAREQGAATAKVSIVEISDFQCPYCHRFYDSTYHRFDSAYVKTGKVRMLYINFPLPMHMQAFAAAKAAMCAGAQGKFWEMHDRLFGSQREWSDQPDAAQRFARMAVELNLDPAAFRDCVENDRTAPLIVNDVMQASGAGINATPTFIINGQRVVNGAVSFQQLSQEIDAALNGQTPTPPAQQPGAAPPASPAPAAPPSHP